MNVNKYKTNKKANVEASSAPNSLALPSGIAPANVENTLYNFNGDLYWGQHNLTTAITEGSKWSISKNKSDIYRDSKIGINTNLPLADLDVNGSVKADSIKVGKGSGFVKSVNGDFQASAIALDDIDGIQLNAYNQKKQVLFYDGKLWSNQDINTISHHELAELDADSHKQYLNEERHNSLAHYISSLNVNDVFTITSNEIVASVPFSFMSSVTFDNKLIVKSLEISNYSGVLKAINGQINTNVSSSDIPEGSNLYFTNGRVVDAAQANFLALDGSNLDRFSGFKRFMAGLDADKLDGKEASDFADKDHKHTHESLMSVNPDDHHDQRHDICGIDHIFNGKPGQFLKITDKNILGFVNISLDDIPNIPFDKIGNGDISGKDIQKLQGIKYNIQKQIDDKANFNHKHIINDINGLESDVLQQYLNKERLVESLKELNTDILSEGNNLYFTDKRVIEIADGQYLRLDGENIDAVDISRNININVDLLDGFHATHFAAADHKHKHNELENINANDHHSQKHDILGGDHFYQADSFTVLQIVEGGQLVFDKVPVEALEKNIPVSSLASGNVLDKEFGYLSGLQANIQDQLNVKANNNHVHQHREFGGLNNDDHKQYYNEQRLNDWLNDKSLDDLNDGISNKVLNVQNVIDVLKLDENDVISWNDKLSLNFDPKEFTVINGVLKLAHDVTADARARFYTVQTDNVYIGEKFINVNSGTASNFALNVAGGALIDQLYLSNYNGVLFAKDGVVKNGAKLENLSDVKINNYVDNGVLVFNNDSWSLVKSADVIKIPEIKENFDYETHKQDMHEVIALNVNNGVLKVDNNIEIGKQDIPSNVYIYGNLMINGLSVINDTLVFNRNNSNIAIDLNLNKVVAGANNIINSLQLFDESDGSIGFSLYNGAEFRFNTIETNEESIAAFEIKNEGLIKFDTTTNKELMFSVGDKADISFTSGGVKVFTICSDDKIGIGTAKPLLSVDTRSFLGVANMGNKPSNWLMFRTDIAANHPLMAFPQDKKLLLGTYDSYTSNGIWNEIMSVSSENISMKAKNININGQIIQPITREKIVDTENNDLQIQTSNALKFTSAQEDFVITGIDKGVDGKQITIINGTFCNMRLEFESASSQAANRFYKNSDNNSITINSKGVVKLLYDGDENRWLVI